MISSTDGVAPIISRGSAWFASIGVEGSAGTKVFALAGDIENTGLVEVPMGVTLGEVIFDIHHVVSEADLVVVFLTIRTSESADRNDYVFMIRLEQGRVAEWREYLDTAHAFQQAGFVITKR